MISSVVRECVVPAGTDLVARNTGIEESVKSKLDETKILTRTQWAVTLIIPDGILTHHAELFVEGNNGARFAKVIHLTGAYLSKQGCDLKEGCHYLFGDKGKVEVKDVSDKKWRWKLKSDTFMRSAEKVQQLIDEAKKEMALFDNKEFTNPTPFHYLGANSWFVKETVHYQIKDPELKEVYNTNRRQFEYFRKARLDPFMHLQNTRMTFSVLGMFTIPLFCIPALAYSYLSIGTISCWEKVDISTTLGKSDIEKNRKFHELSMKANSAIVEHKVRPNSCMSWIKGKLKIVDIDIPDLFWDKMITVTDLYIKQMQNSKEIS